MESRKKSSEEFWRGYGDLLSRRGIEEGKQGYFQRWTVNFDGVAKTHQQLRCC